MFTKKIKEFFRSQKGATTLILSFLILSVLMIVAVGSAITMVAQLNMASQSSDSVKAFYAADAGAERCFYQAIQAPAEACGSVSGNITGSFTLESGIAATYNTTRTTSNQIRSRGCFDSNRVCRELELNW